MLGDIPFVSDAEAASAAALARAMQADITAAIETYAAETMEEVEDAAAAAD